MKSRQITVCIIAVATVITAAAVWYLLRYPIPVLQPTGVVGDRQRALIIFAGSLSLAIVIPVFALLAYFGWKYREGNKKAKYTPSLGGSKAAELLWWVVPSVLIIVISTVTWQSSYALDPYKPVVKGAPAFKVQVVSMDWKWLFIYPDQNLASVNELTIPQNTPIDFELTSDSVMNSFWIPSLGGQMYAMPGMTTHLNLTANKLGSFTGSAANITGKGFADMTFKTKVIKPELIPLWEKSMRVSGPSLTKHTYDELATPGVVPSGELHRYSQVDTGLFDDIVMKYMMPMDGSHAMHGMAM